MNTLLKNHVIKHFKISFVLFILLMVWLNLPVLADASPEAAPKPTSLRKGPYLIYNGHNTQMQIMWQCNGKNLCSISWGTDNSYDAGNAKTKEYGNDHQHSYLITKLKPGKKYFYKVHANDTDYEGYFVAGLKNKKKKIKFFVYGDARTFPYVHNEVAGAIISAYKKDPQLQTIALFTGDMVSFGAEEFSWDNEVFNPGFSNIRKMMASLPLILCVGNHELYTKGYKSTNNTFPLVKKYFPYPYVNATYWSFDYGPAHFTILDQYAKDPEAKQLAWMAKDLEASKKLWKFVILHEPGWSAGISNYKDRKNNKKVQELIQPVLEKHMVTAVFAGHNHYYARALVNGIYHITTGGGGAPLYDPKPYSPKVITTSKNYHFCTVEIDNNAFVFKAVKPDGTVIDTFTLNARIEYKTVPQ